MGSAECRVHLHRQSLHRRLQKSLEKGADHIEGQQADGQHDAHEAGDGRPAAGQHPVDLLGPDSLLALPGFLYRLLTDPLDKVKPHVRDGGAAVHAALLLHLQHYVLNHLKLILIKAQPLKDQLIPGDQLGSREPQGKPCPFRVVFNNVLYRVDGPVDGSAVVVFAAEILLCRLLLVFRDMYRVMDQLVHALISGR